MKQKSFFVVIVIFLFTSLFTSGQLPEVKNKESSTSISSRFIAKRKIKRRSKKNRKKRKKRKAKRKKKKKSSEVRIRADKNNTEQIIMSEVLNAYLDEDYEETIEFASKLLKRPQLRRAASYYIALSLANLELFRSSLYYFGEVVKMGIGNSASTKRYYQQAVNSLLKIADEISDDTVVPYLLKDVTFRKIGIRKKDKFYYYLGKYFYFTGQYKKSLKILKKVSRMTPYFSRSKYVIGVIYAITKRYRKGLSIFHTISTLPKKDIKSELIRDKAYVALARLFYGFGKYKLSQSYYEKITDESPLWMTTVFESSWAYYMNNDYNKVLGKLEVINSPFFDDKFVPEFFILRSVVLLKMCRILELKPSVSKLNDSYSPMIKPIKRFLKEYKRDKKALFKTMENYYYGADNYYGLPKRLTAHVAMEDAIYSSYYKIYSLLDEKEYVREYVQNSPVSGFYKKLSRRLNGYVKDLKKKVSKLIGKRIRYYSELLNLQVDKGRLVKLQYMDGEKKLMEKEMVVYKKSTPSYKTLKDKYVGVSENYIYWPFEAEYWLDELGYHEFRMDDACKYVD